MIALVSPAYDAATRNAAFRACRPGSPNEMLEAPSVMLRPYVSRIRLIVSRVTSTACGSAPTVIARGSITMSASGISYSPWTISSSRAQSVEPLVRRRGDPGLVVREADHRSAVLLHQRQHLLEAVALARDGVDERLSPVDREPCIERLDDRGVDADRQVGVLLHELDRACQEGGLVRQRHTHVHVEHVGAARDLILDVLDDLREITRPQGGGERLAPGGVDPLADDAERLVGSRSGPSGTASGARCARRLTPPRARGSRPG